MSELRGQTCQGAGGKLYRDSLMLKDPPLKPQFKAKAPLVLVSQQVLVLLQWDFCTALNQDLKAKEYGQ